MKKRLRDITEKIIVRLKGDSRDIDRFFAAAGWKGAARTPLQGDDFYRMRAADKRPVARFFVSGRRRKKEARRRGFN